MNKYKTKNIPEKSFYSTKNVILRELGSGKIILDVGCNDGYFGKFDKKNVYYGIDYSREAIFEAKKKYKDISFYDLNSLRKLPWNIKFDVIIFADVLEHIVYPDKVLSFFIKNYLKKNGEIIISLPNIANWQVRLNLLFGKFNYSEIGIMDRTHLHFYTFKNIYEMSEKCNLKTLKILFGASFFGVLVNKIPFLKGILATNIIVVYKHK